MGGNGPHNGPRNSSFGLATLRTDGYAALCGTGKLLTIRVLVTAAQLTATADFPPGSNGSLKIGVAPGGKLPGLSVNDSVPLATNATDAPMRFAGDCGGQTFESLVGTYVSLEVHAESTLLFTIGFAVRGINKEHHEAKACADEAERSAALTRMITYRSS